MSRFAMPARSRTRGSRLTALSAAAAVAFSLVTGVMFAGAEHGAPALADASTGTGGVFVATQGRVLDTRAGYGTGGYTTPMSAGVWRSVPVDGVAGVPSSGVSAVQVAVSALAPITTTGTVSLSADLATPKGGTALDYGSVSGAVSNTAIVAVGSDGKIKVEATSAVNVALDVQGYYTSGDTADGGYVSVTPTRTVDTRYGTGLPHATLGGGSTSTIQVTGTAAVPATATAVFVNFAVLNRTANGGYLTAYNPDSSRPNIGLDFTGTVATSLGTTVPLSAAGTMTVYLAGSSAVDLTVDVIGYFSGTTTTGAFTPATARVATNITLAGTSVTDVRVTGVAGVPLEGAGISAVAMNVQETQTGTAGGYLRVWNPDQAEPATASLSLDGAPSSVSNFVTMQVGSSGDVNVRNSSTDAVKLTVDVQGWYTNLGSAIPAGQDTTQQRIILQGTATGGGNWVTYKYRVGAVPGTTFAKVPTTDVTVPGTSTHPSAWPVSRSGSTQPFDPYTWDLGGTLASTADALVQVEACFGTSSTDPNPACTMPSNVTYSQASFGASFATDQVGPGTVSLLTGDYELSATDVNVASYQGPLSIGRTATTLHPAAASTAASGVFGPGWTADVSGPHDGDADLAVNDQTASGYLIFNGVDGSPGVYQATSSLSSYPISFVGVGDAAADGSTVTKVSASKITMADQDGTVTTWTKPSSGPWQATSVQEASSNSTSTYTYNSAGLVTQILAPVPSGVSCTSPSTTQGCRSLTLAYTTVGSATRLASVSLVAYDPVAVAMSTTELEDYSYDSSGRLSAAWDHRINPNLKTIYTYNSTNALATMTPPGLAAWSFGYDSTGRLSTVSRPDAANAAIATSTVVYGGGSSSITGSGAPVEMGASATGTWDETADLPATATAVFDPNRVPAGTTFSTVGSSDWPYATLHYLDANGREVNTAQYGAGAWQISAAQFDSNGNDIWDLTPRNRAQALTPTSFTDPAAAALTNSFDRADLLASTTVFDPLNPSDDTDDYGPIHPVTLTSGTVVDADDHTSTTYDEGSPGGAFYGLPTTITMSAYTLDGVDHDPVITHKGYAALVSGDTTGWSLYQPTTSTVQMGSSPSSSDLVTATRYNAAGQVTETRLPGAATDGNNNATDARTTVTRYYASGTSGTCVNNALAGLPCSIGPAVQPASGNPLAVKTFTYDVFDNPLTLIETAGSTVRTTATTYDAGERISSKAVAVSPIAAGGTALPAVSYGYGSSTGLPTTVSTTSSGTTTTLTTGYDTLGRTTSYTDATGTTSTSSYDIDGQVTASFDGQLTTTYTYDTSTEHRGMVTGENIGVTGAPSTFTANYDADGTLASETYPSGLTATTSHDNADNTTALTYTQSGSTWMTFTASYDGEDRIIGQSSPQSSQNFTYDPDDRLTTVQDTYSSSCTTRTYGFNAASDRTSLQSYPANAGGNCTTSTTPTGTTSSYDQADRLTNTGYTYDTLGRTQTVPAADAQRIGSHTGTTGTLTIGYDSNDMVSTESQGAAALTFNLDPDQNRTASTSDGTSTTTNHYADDTDNPTWTATGTSWLDDVTGPEGDFTATVDQGGTVTLELPDLHDGIVATAPDITTATGVATYGETTEYGLSRNPPTAATNYGWLGADQRSANNLGGLVTAGARLYNSSTGRFLSLDPIPGGNFNPYVYPLDPINQQDVSGKWTLIDIHKTFHFSWAFLLGGDTPGEQASHAIYGWITNGLKDVGLGSGIIGSFIHITNVINNFAEHNFLVSNGIEFTIGFKVYFKHWYSLKPSFKSHFVAPHLY